MEPFIIMSDYVHVTKIQKYFTDGFVSGTTRLCKIIREVYPLSHQTSTTGHSHLSTVTLLRVIG